MYFNTFFVNLKILIQTPPLLLYDVSSFHRNFSVLWRYDNATGIITFNISVKELNLAFLPIEERVFSLDNPSAYNDYYGGKITEKKLDEIAEQLVNLFNLIPCMYNVCECMRI